MKKLIKGIVEFRKNIRPGFRETFAKLALGQSPDTFFIACSDSRVAPNVFASTDPGDLFVIRNPGNLFAPCGNHGRSMGDVSEVAALEFAILNLRVKDIVVCGHSECGAMIAVTNGRDRVEAPHLRSWLVHVEAAHSDLKAGKSPSPELAPHNQLSQLNVLRQMEHLKTYPLVKEQIKEGKVKVHGWWFDIANAEVYAYSEKQGKFMQITEDVDA